MKDLQLSIKNKWLKVTKSGDKTEDYLDVNDYWFKNLVVNYKKLFEEFSGSEWVEANFRSICVEHIAKHRSSLIVFRKFSDNIIRIDSKTKSNKNRILRFEHAGIEIRTGNPDWGAESGKIYFVIKHGNRVEQHD